MTTTLALELTGPLQSWGRAARAARRDTALEPSKSGVVGLLAAALGRRRSSPIDDLAALRMTVRVDRQGELIEDYQMVGAGYTGDPVWPNAGIFTAEGGHSKFVAQTFRGYLADAAFLVLLEGDADLLQRVHGGLNEASFQLALGRRSCPPAQPLAPTRPAAVTPSEALRRYPRLRDGDPALRVVRELTAAEAPTADELRPDQPIGTLAERRFGPRPIRHEAITIP